MGEHSKRSHAKFAPSAAHRWMNCFGAVNAAKNAPPQIENKYAIKGTYAHEALEHVVKRFKNKEKAAKEALKFSIEKLKKTFPKDDWVSEAAEMISHAERCADLIYSLKPAPEAKLLIENRVVCKQISSDLYGSLDYAWVDEWGILRVIDYKYGAGIPVSPVDEEGNLNPQLMIYAIGLAHQFQYEFDEVKLSIIQPRVFQVSEVPHLEASVSIEQVKEFEEEVREAIQSCKKPDAPLRAGEWCRFCPALLDCPEASTKQLKKAEVTFDFNTGVEAAPDPKGLTVKNLPNVLDACDMLEDWITAVRAHAFRLAESGQKIAGRKLVEKRGVRVWLPGAEKAAQKQFGPLAFRKDFVSPAQLEKAAGKEGARKFIEKYAASVSSGFTLVKESDKRKETSSIAFDLDTE